MDLEGKVAVITGATGRLTRHIVSALKERGVRLALHYRVQRRLAEELYISEGAESESIRLYSADFTSADAINRFAEGVLKDFGRVDILINAASTFPNRSFAEADLDELEELLSLNLKAPFLLAKVFFGRGLSKKANKNCSVIINITDILALMSSDRFFSYSLSKSSMIALTRLLAKALAPSVRVNAIAVGLVDLPDITMNIDKARLSALLERIPLKRAALPDELVETCLFLIENDYITGEVIALDGGRAINFPLF